ncbi:ABC transporter permease [Actinomyces trachealis]|uniref:ABC transporter permease n=1 Tax=Actinomyces trachealis TaxID=2763540 RepID=UPI0018C837BE|nr:ABC transporter permease [Actinomyces trachealis]
MYRFLSSLSAPVAGLVGAVTEAWTQLRIGKLRVLLSLVGVAVAVACMTLVLAIGKITVSAINDEVEKYSGRPGTVTVNVNASGSGQQSEPQDAGPAGPDTYPAGASREPQRSGAAANGPSLAASPEVKDNFIGVGTSMSDSTRAALRVDQAMNDFVQRYQIQSWATNYVHSVRFAFPDGGAKVETKVVSTQYGLLHHVRLAQGRWLRGDDADDASPTLVVSEGFLKRLGFTELTKPITVTSWTPTRTTYTIVGVLKPDPQSNGPCYDSQGNPIACVPPLEAYTLNTAFERWLPADVERSAPTLEVWAGKGADQQLLSLAKKDLGSVFGRQTVQAESNAQSGFNASASGFTRVVTIAGVFVMILGALGLINISMVTVKQRIHEIGVRRAFGATNKRVFFSIMLESVVATVVAGVVGIAIAIVGLRYVPLESLIGVPIYKTTPFPMSAAFIGMVAAAGVGAAAGVIPAMVAVRIRPIDAIRY